MKMSTEDSDFNWVEARQNCSVTTEFEALRQTVEANVKERQRQLGEGSGASPRFRNNSTHEFTVVRNAPLKVAAFCLRGDHIVVEDNNGSKQLDLTLALNDDGECRFKVDGNGECLRWQVVRKPIEDILFLR